MLSKIKIIILSIAGFIVLVLLGLGLLGYFAERRLTLEELQRLSPEQFAEYIEKYELTSQIKIFDQNFEPTAASIRQNETICWLNNSNQKHIIVFADFESPEIGAGVWCRLFLNKERIEYYLQDNPQVKGELIIQ